MSFTYIAKRSILSFGLWGTGDLLAQLVLRHQPVLERRRAGEAMDCKHHPKLSADWIDWNRTKDISIFALFIYGPLASKWYLKLYQVFPQATMSSLLGRLFYDQFLWTPVMMSIFFSAMALMKLGATAEGVEECRYRMREVIPNTLKVNWVVWIPLQGFNFVFVPRDRWVYVINIFAVPWNAYLAYTAAA